MLGKANTRPNYIVVFQITMHPSGLTYNLHTQINTNETTYLTFNLKSQSKLVL